MRPLLPKPNFSNVSSYLDFGQSKNRTSMLPLLGAGIDAATGLIGQLINRGHEKKMQREAFAHNREMAEYAYSKDLEMWDRQNQYNTPEAQMQRLTEAGLNPNMVYGSGTVAGNTSGQMPKYNAPTRGAVRLTPLEIPQVLGAFMSLKQQQANIDQTRAQTANIIEAAGTQGLKKKLLELGVSDATARKVYEDHYYRQRASKMFWDARGSEAGTKRKRELLLDEEDERSFRTWMKENKGESYFEDRYNKMMGKDAIDQFIDNLDIQGDTKAAKAIRQFLQTVF